MDKKIHRDAQSSAKIFDDRSLARDYASLLSLLRPGLRVLDVGCGTGAITRDIARAIGESGEVIGIDNTEAFINSGRESYGDVSNLTLVNADLFTFSPERAFDLVVAARVIQWIPDPGRAVKRLASFLKPSGYLSVLDYNHEELEWIPKPPDSMQMFYKAFLKWRADSFLDNRIADNLAAHFGDAGLRDIEVIHADEIYRYTDKDFHSRAGIWSKVAGLRQIAEEGYISEAAVLKAVDEYNQWISNEGRTMVMKLKEVRGKK